MTPAEMISLAERSTAQRVARLYADHGRLGELCDQLEAIADDLPRACPTRCRRAAAQLMNLVPAHHAFEAGVLTDVFGADRRELLARILGQHAEDEGLALEIAMALEPISAGAQPDGPETLGYMLRCFFNNCRRSMLVEELALQAALGSGVRPPRRDSEGGPA